MDEDTTPLVPSLPAEVEMRIFNQLLHKDFKRSASTFLRLSRHHFSTYAPKVNHTVIITDTNLPHILRLVRSRLGLQNDYRLWVKRIVFTRMCPNAELTAFLNGLNNTEVAIFPALQHVIVSRQYCFEAAVRVYNRIYFDRHSEGFVQTTTLFDRLTQGISAGLTVDMDMDIPVDEMLFDEMSRKIGIQRHAGFIRRIRSVPKTFNHFWGDDTDESAVSTLLSAWACFTPSLGPKGTDTKSYSQSRYSHLIVRNMPRLWVNSWLCCHISSRPDSSLTVGFSHLCPLYPRWEADTFASGSASTSLVDDILDCFDDDKRSQILIQNAEITPETLEATLLTRGDILSKRKAMQEWMSHISCLPPSADITSPTDFDPLGGLVDCRNWEILDYAAWDAWKLANKSNVIGEMSGAACSTAGVGWKV